MTTRGLVQFVGINPEVWDLPDDFELHNAVFACVGVGPSPADTEVFVISRRQDDPPHIGAFKNSIVDALVTAFVSHREVTIEHGEDDNKVVHMSIQSD